MALDVSDCCHVLLPPHFRPYFFFFFNHPATTEIYTLSLHDALPISQPRQPLDVSLIDDRVLPGNRKSLCFSDRKSTRLNSSHVEISYAVFCLKKKKKNRATTRYTHQTHTC